MGKYKREIFNISYINLKTRNQKQNVKIEIISIKHKSEIKLENGFK